MPSGQHPPEGKMKITVNVATEIVKAAKKAAIDRETTLGELIEEGLRVILARKGGGDKNPKR
jgi:hypothetical protein